MWGKLLRFVFLKNTTCLRWNFYDFQTRKINVYEMFYDSVRIWIIESSTSLLPFQWWLRSRRAVENKGRGLADSRLLFRLHDTIFPNFTWVSKCCLRTCRKTVCLTAQQRGRNNENWGMKIDRRRERGGGKPSKAKWKTVVWVEATVENFWRI